MKKRKLLLPFIILIAIIYSIISILKQSGQLIRPQLIKVDKDFSSLEELVSSSLRGTKETYAVVIKNMHTGKGFRFNEDKVYEAGSLYKLWVMATVYEEIKKGEIKEDEILSQRVEVLNEKFEIEEDEAELTEGEITMSVGQAINQMIAISHNFAALLLLEKVGNSQIPSQVTAKDAALFFENLYKGELVSPEYSQKMIDLLKKQQLNNGLPKYLPKDTQIAHKTGDIGWFKHDAGIVFTSKGDYIIVVLSETDSPTGAQEKIAQVSKAVYEYFNK